MDNMFESAESFNHSVNDWNVSNVMRMNGMFALTSSMTYSVENWKINIGTTVQYMFGNSKLQIIYTHLQNTPSLSNWRVQFNRIKPTKSAQKV